MQKLIRKQITKRQKDKEAICPFCKSQRLIRRGVSKSKNFIKQKYACLNCNKFTVNPLILIN